MNNLFTSTLMVSALAAAPVFAQGIEPNRLSERRGIEHRLVKLVVNNEDIALPDRPVITLTFLEGNRVAGRAPVNLFFGGYHLSDDGLLHWATPGFGSTMMAGPERLMNLEQTFFQALSAVNRLQDKGSAIVLDNEEKSVWMVFEGNSVEQTMSSLMGTRLLLVRLVAEGREIPIPAGARVILSLDSDGHAVGNAGVNRYRGAVRFSSSGQIHFASVMATTRMAGPEELMALERSYLAALAAARRWRPSLNGAVMENANGATILEFTALP